jgi:hypothetical protein
MMEAEMLIDTDSMAVTCHLFSMHPLDCLSIPASPTSSLDEPEGSCLSPKEQEFAFQCTALSSADLLFTGSNGRDISQLKWWTKGEIAA